MLNVRVDSTKKCAFCTHWYDPTNAHIKPKAPRIGVWTLDEKASCYCDVKRHDMRGAQFCSEYQCKL